MARKQLNQKHSKNLTKIFSIMYSKNFINQQKNNSGGITPKYPISVPQVIKNKNSLMHAVKYGTIIYLQKELELLIKMYI